MQDFIAHHGFACLVPSFLVEVDSSKGIGVVLVGWEGWLPPVFSVYTLWVGWWHMGTRTWWLFHIALDDHGALAALTDWIAAAATFGSGTVASFIRRGVAQI